MKKQKGITLIALVITIIVLLILAGVAISAIVSDDGIINKAGKGKTDTIKGSRKELLSLAAQEAYIDALASEITKDQLEAAIAKTFTGDETAEILNDEAPWRVKIGTDEFEVSSMGVVTEVKNDTSTGEGDTPTEPEVPDNGEKVYLDEETSGIGYYVNIDGKYGIIYADLAFSKTGTWVNTEGSYSYNAENHDNLKKYYLNGMYDPDGADKGFEEKPVLVVDETEGGSIDRFYVMALEAIKNETTGYSSMEWYAAARANSSMTDYAETSAAFGKGKINTSIIMTKWDNKYYGDQDTGRYQDIWGKIKTQVAAGWFVPSSGELAAFMNEFDITKENYSSYALKSMYWSSTQRNEYSVFIAALSGMGFINTHDVNNYASVMLSITY